MGEVLATVEHNPVAIRNKHLLGTSFHPEITNDKSWALFFLKELCGIPLQQVDNSALPAVGMNMLFPSQHNSADDKTLSSKEVTAIVAKGLTHTKKRGRDDLLLDVSPFTRRKTEHGIIAKLHSAKTQLPEAMSLNSSLS